MFFNWHLSSLQINMCRYKISTDITYRMCLSNKGNYLTEFRCDRCQSEPNIHHCRHNISSIQNRSRQSFHYDENPPGLRKIHYTISLLKGYISLLKVQKVSIYYKYILYAKLEIESCNFIRKKFWTTFYSTFMTLKQYV